MTDTVSDLLSRYWQLAYAEGKEGRTHDTENGDAQETLSAIMALLSTASAALEEAARVVESFSPIREAFETEDEGGIKWQYPAVRTPIYNPDKLAAAIRALGQS